MLQDGVCTLFATPADSSAVLIDGKVAVYVNGCHAVIGRSGSVVLQAGYQKFILMYFQGGEEIDLGAGTGGSVCRNRSLPRRCSSEASDICTASPVRSLKRV